MQRKRGVEKKRNGDTGLEPGRSEENNFHMRKR